MVRSLTAGMITEVTALSLEPVFLLKLAFPGGDVNMWTGVGDKLFSGDTYTGVGDFLELSEIEETETVRAAGVTFSLSGISSTIISTALTENYSERFAKLWFAALDSSKAFVADPYLMLTARMDVMTIIEGPETATITMRVENRMVDLERPKLRRYTAEDQKNEFAGDLGLDFVSSLSDGSRVIWGRG